VFPPFFTYMLVVYAVSAVQAGLSLIAGCPQTWELNTSLLLDVLVKYIP
jgi:hypothetical protein